MTTHPASQTLCIDAALTVIAATATVLLAFVASTALAATPSAPAPNTVTARDACAALDHTSVGGATLAATLVPAHDDVPVYCKIEGELPPALQFELRLPDAWNGKLYYGGGGGYDGSIPPLSLPALLQGYAQVASDAGHQGDGMSATFALNDPFAAQMFGSLSVPTVTATAIDIVRAAYGVQPSKSYFEGCSNGGREALMAVQRNPALFDGVIARAPAYNWVGFTGQFNRTARALAKPGAALNAAKTALLAKQVRNACDALDGLTDGVVANAAACTKSVANIAALRCADGVDAGDACLSDAQLAVVDAWTTDAVFAGNGTYRSRGFNLTGNEDDANGFALWASGNGDVHRAGQYLLQDSTFKYYLAHDARANSLGDVPWDHNQNGLYAMAALNDATQADIRAFVDHGGKLMLWHGGADTALSVNSTIEYVDRVHEALGAEKSAAAIRFYVAPGVTHCGGGPGADDTDLLTALDQWVTQSTAPGTLRARKLGANGAVVRELPLCPYPQFPAYTGPASDAAAARIAERYTCKSP